MFRCKVVPFPFAFMPIDGNLVEIKFIRDTPLPRYCPYNCPTSEIAHNCPKSYLPLNPCIVPCCYQSHCQPSNSITTQIFESKPSEVHLLNIHKALFKSTSLMILLLTTKVFAYPQKLFKSALFIWSLCAPFRKVKHNRKFVNHG